MTHLLIVLGLLRHQIKEVTGVCRQVRLHQSWIRCFTSQHLLWVINNRWSKGLVAAVKPPVGDAGPAPNQENHLQHVGGGCELGLSPAFQQKLVAPSGVFHVELVLFYMAGVSRGQIFKVQVDPLCGVYTDGPVAPQRWVGAQIIRREELSRVPA